MEKNTVTINNGKLEVERVTMTDGLVKYIAVDTAKGAWLVVWDAVIRTMPEELTLQDLARGRHQGTSAFAGVTNGDILEAFAG